MILLLDTEDSKIDEIIKELKKSYPLYELHKFPTIFNTESKTKLLSEHLRKETVDLWKRYNKIVIKDIINRIFNFKNKYHIFILNINDKDDKEFFRSNVNSNMYKTVNYNDIFNNKEESII